MVETWALGPDRPVWPQRKDQPVEVFLFAQEAVAALGRGLTVLHFGIPVGRRQSTGLGDRKSNF